MYFMTNTNTNLNCNSIWNALQDIKICHYGSGFSLVTHSLDRRLAVTDDVSSAHNCNSPHNIYFLQYYYTFFFFFYFNIVFKM